MLLIHIKTIPISALCNSPPNVANAIMQGPSSPVEGDVVTYICTDGYALISDNNAMTCVGGDQWTGTVLCEGKLVFRETIT